MYTMYARIYEQQQMPMYNVEQTGDWFRYEFNTMSMLCACIRVCRLLKQYPFNLRVGGHLSN